MHIQIKYSEQEKVQNQKTLDYHDYDGPYTDEFKKAVAQFYGKGLHILEENEARREFLDQYLGQKRQEKSDKSQNIFVEILKKNSFVPEMGESGGDLCVLWYQMGQYVSVGYEYEAQEDGKSIKMKEKYKNIRHGLSNKRSTEEEKECIYHYAKKTVFQKQYEPIIYNYLRTIKKKGQF